MNYCNLCKTTNPTIHFTLSLRYTMVKVDLCATCAAKLGVSDPATSPFDSVAVFKALSQAHVPGLTMDKIQVPKGGNAVTQKQTGNPG